MQRQQQELRAQHARLSISFGKNKADNVQLISQAPVLHRALVSQRRQHTLVRRVETDTEELGVITSSFPVVPAFSARGHPGAGRGLREGRRDGLLAPVEALDGYRQRC